MNGLSKRSVWKRSGWMPHTWGRTEQGETSWRQAEANNLGPWHKPMVIEAGGVWSADFGDHRVEREALFARDAAAIGVIRPRGEHQKAALGAGLEVVPRWLELGGKAVLTERDERKLCFKRGAGDGFLARADAGAYQDGPALGGIQQTFGFRYERVGCDASRTLNLKSVGAIEQKGVSVGGVGASRECELVDAREVVRVLADEREAARVVRDVAKERFQLAAVGQYTVVIARGKQVGRIRHIWRITGRRITGQRTIGLGTPDFEAANDFAQMAAHARTNEEKPVKVIGHDDAGKQLNFRMVAGNFAPAGFDAFTEWSLGDGRTFKSSQNRPSPFDFERNHVNATFVVIVAEASLLHFVGQGIGNTCHGHIIPNGSIAFKAARGGK